VSTAGASGPSAQEGVVLVHGLWTNRFVMAYLARRMAHSGFAAHALSYRSVRRDLADNADALAALLARLPHRTLHLVGHSLGGLVVLACLARHAPRRVRRVVLLTAPVSGCETGRKLAGTPWARPFLGCTSRLWTSPEPILVDPRYEVGTIAGTLPVGLGAVVARPAGPSDGVVRTDEARYPRSRDHVDLPLAHSQVLVSPLAARQIAAFLHTGCFQH
jgi:pimeloyl-ACP methyl ester carboxylesterase